MLKFQKGALARLSNLSSHFIEKSPLKSAIVRYAQCFDPVYMESNRCDAENKFTFLLQKLLALKRLPSAKIAEQAKEQFRTFLNDTVSLEYEKFQLFDKFKGRVDVFLGNYLSAEKYRHVFPVFQLICTLSHGQSVKGDLTSIKSIWLIIYKNLEEKKKIKREQGKSCKRKQVFEQISKIAEKYQQLN